MSPVRTTKKPAPELVDDSEDYYDDEPSIKPLKKEDPKPDDPERSKTRCDSVASQKVETQDVPVSPVLLKMPAAKSV